MTNSSFQAVSSEHKEQANVEIKDTDDDEPQPKHAKKHSKKKKKKTHKYLKEKRVNVGNNLESTSEFTGKENYYVDKKPCNNYFAMETLDRNDSARYRVHFHHIGTITSEQWRMLYRRPRENVKRYFTKFKSETNKNNDGKDGKEPAKMHSLSEDDFTAKTKVFNKNLATDSHNIEMWLEYVHFQDHFYMKMTKVQMAERKMEILNKALRENPNNNELYHEYINVLECAYPSFEVSKFLDILIQKGITEFMKPNIKPNFFQPITFPNFNDMQIVYTLLLRFGQLYFMECTDYGDSGFNGTVYSSRCDGII